MSKKVLSLVLALVMVLGSFGTVFAAATTPTGNEKVDKLIELGLVKGYADGTYGLAQAITRAEMATMVVRALDLEAVANASAAFPSQYTDMNSANVLWARGFVNVAAGQGIVKGYPEGTFLPANNVTYAEAAAMLVRVLGGLTAAEEANAVWPTTYLAKAAQLGVFADVDGIVDYNAPATRENLFEMVFNTLTAGTNLLIANTVEGIVVENYRTEALAKDEVVVHVMKDQDARDDKYDFEEGEEFKVVVTPELAEKGVDVETLLGKVVKVSYDKAGKVVGIEQLAGYTYLTGTVDSITEKQIELNEKKYTVSKSESRDAADERLYQVYLNNDDVEYDELFNTKKDEVYTEYANITVRNGKVLFIDAFKFEDIAPVAADFKADDVAYYDDSRDGSVRTLVVDEDAYVITLADGVSTLGNNEAIKANDVIHWYKDNEGVLTVFVKTADEAVVEGEFDRSITGKVADPEDFNIQIDDVKYPAYYSNANKNAAVYSIFSTSLEFDTLTSDYHNELEGFKGEEVVALLDLFGNVQLVSSDKIDSSFFAIITAIRNRQSDTFRLFRQDGEQEYYDSTLRDTTFYVENANVAKKTTDVNFHEFELVKASANDLMLTKVTRLETEPTTDTDDDALTVSALVYGMDRNTINFGADNLDLGSKAPVFVIDANNKVRVFNVSTFLEKYGNKVAGRYIIKETDGIEGYVSTTKTKSGATVVDAIVITDYVVNGDSEITAKITRVDQSGSKILVWLDKVQYTYEGTKTIGALELLDGKVVVADVTEDMEILELADAGLIGTFLISKIDGRFITLKDLNGVPRTLRLSEYATTFGTIAEGEKVQVDKITDGATIEVINRVTSALKTWAGAGAADTKDVITAIGTTNGKTIVTINGEIYEFAGTANELKAGPDGLSSTADDIAVNDKVTFSVKTLNGVEYIYNVKLAN